jgi:type VI secretion system (T6SS) baseplate-like injector VgrG
VRPDSFVTALYGLHYAVVCDNKDPDNLDRVKVRLPWLDGGDTDQTHWAQLLTPMEGKKFGWYTLPDVDDVVVVMFIGGDVQQPVIIGGVWSKTDNPPEPNEDGKNNFRGYRSRCGHRLVLDDSSKTKVYIADKTGKNVLGVGQFDKDGAGPNVCGVYKPPMSGSTGVSLSTMEGKLELSCPSGELAVKADGDIKISSKTTIDIKAGSDLKVEATTAKITSASPSSYDASKIDIA